MSALHGLLASSILTVADSLNKVGPGGVRPESPLSIATPAELADSASQRSSAYLKE